MVAYPLDPRPSSISAPAYIDPILSFQTDSGVETRRALHSRPRRSYTLEYLGQSTQDLRIIVDFLTTLRFGAFATFEFFHPTAVELVPGANTTPVWLLYYHATQTGQYVYVESPPALAGPHRVTRVHPGAIALDGTVAQGDITVQVRAYLPTAVARLSGETWDAAAKVSGTDRVGPDRPGAPIGALAGRFSWNVHIEEVF